MLTRATFGAAFTSLLCIASTSARAQVGAAGVVTDPCAVAKTQEPASQSTSRPPNQDFGKLCQYRARDAEQMQSAKQPPRVVFMGDSITEFWGDQHPAFFTDGVIDRGISGQTTAQMLLRFRQDVIDLHPQAVHIMAGTNDVAGNTGPVTLEEIEGNIASMAELANAHGIRVMLGSIPPAAHFAWRPQVQPVDTIRTLNAWIKDYAAKHGFTYVDYYGAMATAEGGMKPGMADDGVHPTRKGYAVMEPLASAAMQTVLSAK